MGPKGPKGPKGLEGLKGSGVHGSGPKLCRTLGLEPPMLKQGTFGLRASRVQTPEIGSLGINETVCRGLLGLRLRHHGRNMFYLKFSSLVRVTVTLAQQSHVFRVPTSCSFSRVVFRQP